MHTLDSLIIWTLPLRNCFQTCSARSEKKNRKKICACLLNYMYCLLLCIILIGLVADDSAVRFQENIFQQCRLDVILFLVLSCFTPIGFLSVCAHLCVAVAGSFHPVWLSAGSHWFCAALLSWVSFYSLIGKNMV